MSAEADFFAAMIAAHERGSARIAVSGRRYETRRKAIGAHFKPPASARACSNYCLSPSTLLRRQTLKWFVAVA